MFLTNQQLYKQTAKEWVQKYANMESLQASKIGKLKDMGFSEAQARAALEKFNWEEEPAINSLIGG